MTTNLTLRDYQQISFDKIWKAWKSTRNIIYQGPVGAGKSEIACKILETVANQGKKGIFVVHGRTLVYQFSKRMKKYGIPHGIFMANEERSNHPIQVVSIDTLVSRFNKNDLPFFDYIIIDEAHEIKRYELFWESQNGFKARKLGLSATPALPGMKGMGAYFDKMIYGPSPRWLINNGFLIKPKVVTYDFQDTSGVKVDPKTFEFNRKELDELMAKDVVAADAFERWYEHCRGRKTIAFCAGVKNSMMTQEVFEFNGVPCAHVDGTTPQDERDEILTALRQGDIDIVFNNRVFDRGFDFPELSALMDLQANMDFRTYVQKGGRIMRPHENKDSSVYLDLCGNFYRHGGPFWQTTIYPLHEDDVVKTQKDLSDKDDEQRKQEGDFYVDCPQCHTSFLAKEKVCPNCGHKLQPEYAKNRLREIEIALGVYDEDTKQIRAHKPTTQEKFEIFSQLLAIEKERGYKARWADNVYRDHFGVYPRVFNNVKVASGEIVSLPKSKVAPTDGYSAYVEKIAFNRKGSQKR